MGNICLMHILFAIESSFGIYSYFIIHYGKSSLLTFRDNFIPCGESDLVYSIIDQGRYGKTSRIIGGGLSMPDQI